MLQCSPCCWVTPCGLSRWITPTATGLRYGHTCLLMSTLRFKGKVGGRRTDKTGT